MFDLEKHNTFKMKVKAKNGLFINTAEDLNKVDTDKYLILGSGSDVLFVDDYEGTVLINAIKSLGIIFKDPNACKLLKNIQVVDNIEELKSKLRDNKMK